jgi:adenylate cyclase class IV
MIEIEQKIRRPGLRRATTVRLASLGAVGPDAHIESDEYFNAPIAILFARVKPSAYVASARPTA